MVSSCIAPAAAWPWPQIDGDEGGYNPTFTPGGLALYACVYLVLMSIGAGLAIPGGLFMPSIVVRGQTPVNVVPCLSLRRCAVQLDNSN